MKRLFKIISITLVGLLFALSLYIMIFGSIARKNDELLYIFNYSYSFVPTESMEGDNEDSIEKGSFIFSKKEKFENLKIGDIIVFKSTDETSPLYGKLIVHRIIDKTEDNKFITKGDNNSYVDPFYITKENYRAKVTKSFKLFNLGNKIGSIQIQILFIIIIFLIGFSIYQVFVIIKTIKEDNIKKIKEEERERLKQEVLEEMKKED